jgi:O-antigen ligase
LSARPTVLDAAPSATARVIRIPSWLLHAIFARIELLFLATLAIILFRPPDVQLYEMDRIALVALAYFVLLRAFFLRQILPLAGSINLPLLGLLALGLWRLLAAPYQAQDWSVFAAKWVVPILLFNLAGLVFVSSRALRSFEIFSWITLSYLALTAVFFLLGWNSLIFPQFILDENMGIHVERARGPFLQAVANGVALNVLALIALDSFRRRRLPKILAVLFFILLPFAVLATKTRAVWLSFAISIAALAILSKNRRIYHTCIAGILLAALGVWVAVAAGNDNRTFKDRFEDASPVEFRMALYQAGWEMFKQKPILGWSAPDIQEQLEQRIEEFHQDAFYFHNTFLEVAVSYGLVGLTLYLWLIISLLKLARRRSPARMYAISNQFLDAEFRPVWMVLLSVYLLNACFVVMNYQFVNGFLFTLAGILAAQDRRLGYANQPKEMWEYANAFNVGYSS